MYKRDSEDDVSKCLKDVVRGFTLYKDKFFIKHLDIFEDDEVRAFYNSQMDILTDIPTRQEQESMLIENDIWTKEQESNFNLVKVRLEAAKSTLPNVLIESQRKPIEKQIEELSLEYLTLSSEKNEYMGSVREDVANENTCDYIIQTSVFEDESFSTMVFKSMDELYENSPTFLKEIKDIVFFVKLLASDYMCKKVACCSSFQALINVLPKGEEYKLFQKPVIQLSSNQIALIQYGNIFRSIFENYEIPDEVAEDPDKILEIPKQAKKIQEMQQKSESTDLNSSYVGASSEEMRKMGMSGTDVFDVLEKSGKKSLGKEDLI